MTLEKIKARVKNITKVSGDDEVAHNEEDSLYFDFVKHISETGNDEQRKMAKAILKTEKLNFSRCYA